MNNLATDFPTQYKPISRTYTPVHHNHYDVLLSIAGNLVFIQNNDSSALNVSCDASMNYLI